MQSCLRLQLTSLTLCVMLGGCADPTKTIVVSPADPSSPAAAALRRRPEIDPALFKDDIYKVICFYPNNMWKSFDAAGDSNPEGFAFVLHLLSQSTSRGAYADGLITIEIFTIDRAADQTLTRNLAYSWETATHELPHRTATMIGYGYQPALYWSDTDVYGKEIDIVVKYTSPAGKVIQAQTKRARVPQRRV